MQTATTATYIHPFEQSGLGAAPFRFLGVTEKTYQACPGAQIQPGSSCDHCSTGIRYEFWIESSDGKKSKVGSDCILKRLSKGSRIRSEVERELAKRKRERAAQRFEEAMASLGADVELLADEPHPNKGMASDGRTMRDYVNWMARRAGDRGRLKITRIIETAIEKKIKQEVVA